MNLVKRNSLWPTRNLFLWDDVFDTFDLFGYPRRYRNRKSLPSQAQADRPLYPNVDVVESETEYVIEAELPGVDKENLNVTLQDKYLTLEATSETKKEEDDGKSSYREIGRGYFKRSFLLPDSVKDDSESINATYRDGILKVRLPKIEQPAKEEEERTSSIPVNFE